MIKVYNNIIPFKGFMAMTIWPWLFIRKQYRWDFFAVDENHEDIHACQQKEVLVVSALLLIVAVFVFGLPWWWLFSAPLVFFLWYVVEYAIRCAIYGSTKHAYRNISFEQEAFVNQPNFGYLKGRKHFAFLNFIFKKTYI